MCVNPVRNDIGKSPSSSASGASALSTEEIAQGREVGDVVVTKDGAPVVFEVVFAFAFHAFTPDGQWMLGAD